ncbi:MAG: DHHA1 domain-containing protein [bacterium]
MLEAVTRALEGARTVVMTAPSDLDADAIGALEALRLGIARRWPAAQVCIVLDEPVPPTLQFICDSEHFHEASAVDVRATDVAVVVDGDPRRLQQAGPHFTAAACTVMVDHHRSSADAPVDARVFDPAEASTTRLVLTLLDHWGVALDAPIATALYAGLVFDTGAFRYRNTTPDTLRAAARLVEAGVDHTTVIERILLEQGEGKARLRGRILGRFRRAADGRIAYAGLSEAEGREGNTGGIVDELIFLRGVEVGILLTARGRGLVKVSLRSRSDLDVAAIAQTLAPRGGGHRQAAGATIEGSLKAVTERVVAAVEAAMAAAAPPSAPPAAESA